MRKPTVYINGSAAEASLFLGGIAFATQGQKYTTYYDEFYMPGKAVPLAYVIYTDSAYTSPILVGTLSGKFLGSDLFVAANAAMDKEPAIVYPNPSANDITISRPGFVPGEYVSLKFTDLAGRVIIAKKLPWLKEAETLSLDVIPNGIYQLIIERGNTVLSTHKIIRQF